MCHELGACLNEAPSGMAAVRICFFGRLLGVLRVECSENDSRDDTSGEVPQQKHPYIRKRREPHERDAESDSRMAALAMSPTLFSQARSPSTDISRGTGPQVSLSYGPAWTGSS